MAALHFVKAFQFRHVQVYNKHLKVYLTFLSTEQLHFQTLTNLTMKEPEDDFPL